MKLTYKIIMEGKFKNRTEDGDKETDVCSVLWWVSQKRMIDAKDKRQSEDDALQGGEESCPLVQTPCIQTRQQKAVYDSEIQSMLNTHICIGV